MLSGRTKEIKKSLTVDSFQTAFSLWLVWDLPQEPSMALQISTMLDICGEEWGSDLIGSSGITTLMLNARGMFEQKNRLDQSKSTPGLKWTESVRLVELSHWGICLKMLCCLLRKIADQPLTWQLSTIAVRKGDFERDEHTQPVY